MGESRPLVPGPHPVQKDPFTGPPKPFAFKYGVVDVDTGSNFDHAQQQDSNGVVTGERFSVLFHTLIHAWNVNPFG